MKFIVVIVVSLAAFCLAQPFVTSGPDPPETSYNVRVKRQNLVRFPCRCAIDQVWLRKCITCEEYLDLTGDDSCPVCPPNITETNVRVKRQAMINVPSQVQCPSGKVWLKTRCVTCRMYMEITEGDFPPECSPTTSIAAPDQPKNAFNLRVKRQAILIPHHQCPSGQVWLKTRCVSCEKYVTITEGDFPPECPPTTSNAAPDQPKNAFNVRVKRQAVIIPHHQCPTGQVWLKTRCVSCEKYLKVTEGAFSPECPPTTSTAASDQPKNAFNVRVKRQHIIKTLSQCPSGQVWLKTRCISCETYFDLTEDDDFRPECPTTTTTTVPDQPDTANDVRVKRQTIIDVPCRCASGQVWLKTRCVTCEKYLDLTGAYSCPVCQPVKFRKHKKGKKVKNNKIKNMMSTYKNKKGKKVKNNKIKKHDVNP